MALTTARPGGLAHHKGTPGCPLFRTGAAQGPAALGRFSTHSTVWYRALEAPRSAKPPGSQGFRIGVCVCVSETRGTVCPLTSCHCHCQNDVTLPRDRGGDRLHSTRAENRLLPEGRVPDVPLAFCSDGAGAALLCSAEGEEAPRESPHPTLRLDPRNGKRQTPQDVFARSGENLSLPPVPSYSLAERDGERGNGHRKPVDGASQACPEVPRLPGGPGTPSRARRAAPARPGAGRTSSGSASLNSHPSPVQLMNDWHDLSDSNSRRNCHSWMGPLPGERAG